MNSYGFGGRAIVIPGGAGGIGVECAKLLAAGGKHVHLVGSREDALDAAAAVPDGGTGRGSSDYTPYSCAKAGLHDLVRSLAKKFSPGVPVNAVAPGPIVTRMTTRIIEPRAERVT